MTKFVPNIQGQHQIVAITPDSPGMFGRNAISGMVYAIDIAEGERADILEPGTCLIEMADGSRHLARISHGALLGPMRVAQVEALSEASFQSEIKRLSRKNALLWLGKMTIGFTLPGISALMGIALIVAGFVLEQLPDANRLVLVFLGALNVLAGQMLASRYHAACRYDQDIAQQEEGALRTA